ncbi:MAG: peptidoglycan-associated lipoprotein Pal [Candidatus Binatia bacterium]
MRNRRISPQLGLVFVALLWLTGCPPPPTSKPLDPSSAGAESAQRAPGTEVSQPSSLEAFRRGREIPSVLPTSRSSALKDIYFDFDRYNLRPDARETLKTNAAWLKANPSARAEIEGHADERGTNEYNLALGARRAQSTKDYLTTLGVSSDRLSTISYGEELPVCKEKTEGCWNKNRRIHFVTITVRPSS